MFNVIEALMNDKELVVRYNLQASKMGIGMMAFFIIFLLLIIWASSSLQILIGAYLTRVIMIVLVMLNTLFVYGLLYMIWLINFNKKPLAILNAQGIWVNHFGLIAWNDVQSCQIYNYPRTPLEVVSVAVKDIKKLSKQASISGKITIFWAKMFQYPPILLANATVDNETITAYAQAYIKDSE